ncbi:hypothetical protein T492DRAFT_336608 [Pavlovales sp. CCMP2436]|nr:hypothetical protein T492DRAFT_336608 [Pavlovales sp. CCMP2436]
MARTRAAGRNLKRALRTQRSVCRGGLAILCFTRGDHRRGRGPEVRLLGEARVRNDPPPCAGYRIHTRLRGLGTVIKNAQPLAWRAGRAELSERPGSCIPRGPKGVECCGPHGRSASCRRRIAPRRRRIAREPAWPPTVGHRCARHELAQRHGGHERPPEPAPARCGRLYQRGRLPRGAAAARPGRDARCERRPARAAGWKRRQPGEGILWEG